MARATRAFERRFGDSRPGLQLVGIEDAAIPVTVLRADVLAQERKELPITEEFVLRFADQGVMEIDSIAKFLGIDLKHVIEAAAAQIACNSLRQVSPKRVELTPQGVEVVRNAAAIQPVLRNLPVKFDRLTWQLADYPESLLITRREAQARGLMLLPALKNARIALEDVTPVAFNSLLRGDRVQVLRVHKVVSRKHLYLPAQVLLYGDALRRELELALCIDDDLSPAHGEALEGLDGVERLGLTMKPSAPRPILDAALEDQRSAAGEGVEAGGKPQGAVAAPVRAAGTLEHAHFLEGALQDAAGRLLITSVGMSARTVNDAFVALLRGRLRAGVQVTIGFASGAAPGAVEDEALARLLELRGEFGNLSLVGMASPFRNTLICDGVWVATTYEWLSNGNRSYRVEAGTVVEVREEADREYMRLLEELGVEA